MIDLNIEKISNRWYEFKVPSNWIRADLSSAQESQRVKVWIPDLMELKHSVWGDWGPMYSFDLTQEQRVLIEEGNQVRELNQAKLRVEAPMLATQREETPFFILIQDPARGFDFHLYLSEDWNLKKLEIASSRVKPLVIDEPELQQAVI